jgi:hypothetical protein
VAFFAFNVHINSLPQEEQEAFDKSQHEKVTDFTASLTNIVFCFLFSFLFFLDRNGFDGPNSFSLGPKFFE